MLGRPVTGESGSLSAGQLAGLSLRALLAGLLAAAAAIAQPGTLDSFGDGMLFVMGAILFPALVALVCTAPRFSTRSFTANVVVAAVVYAATIALTYEPGGSASDLPERIMAFVGLLVTSLLGIVAVGLPLYTLQGARGTRRPN